MLASSDGGMRFSVNQRNDRAPLTAVVVTPSGAAIGFSKLGVVNDLVVQPETAVRGQLGADRALPPG